MNRCVANKGAIALTPAIGQRPSPGDIDPSDSGDSWVDQHHEYQVKKTFIHAPSDPSDVQIDLFRNKSWPCRDDAPLLVRPTTPGEIHLAADPSSSNPRDLARETVGSGESPIWQHGCDQHRERPVTHDDSEPISPRRSTNDLGEPAGTTPQGDTKTLHFPKRWENRVTQPFPQEQFPAGLFDITASRGGSKGTFKTAEAPAKGEIRVKCLSDNVGQCEVKVSLGNGFSASVTYDFAKVGDSCLLPDFDFMKAADTKTNSVAVKCSISRV